MYKIKAIVDGKTYTIHDPRVKALTVGGNPYFEVGDNINGSASFKVYPTHPYYSKVKKLTTDVIIYRDDEPEFYGRVLYDDEDFSGTKSVFVEGELAYLCDSIQRPKVYHDITVKAYVQDLIDIHNSQVEERKQFVVGRVTVTDSNDSLYRYSNYEDTRTAFKEKLTSRLGGHLVIRHEDGLRILDYLSDEDYYTRNTQGIRFGKNLLDFSKNMDASDLVTCVIPLGAKLDEEEQDPELEAISDQRLTIASVNGGVDYVTDDNAVKEYGKIYKTVTWDDVTLPENLMKKGEEYLKSAQFEKMVLEVKAIDLNLTDDSFQKFDVGNKIQCTSEPNGLDKEFPLTKRKVYLTSFKNNTVTLGDETSVKSYTSSNRQSTAQIEETIKTIPSKSEILQEALRSAQDLINKQVASGYAVHVPNEFIVADDTDYKNKAKNLWRWGLGGFAHYSQGYDGPIDGVALTMDGKINGGMLLANSVKTESIDAGYRKEVESKITTSSNKAKADAEATAKKYSDSLKESIDSEIEDVNNAMSDLDEQLDYVASDGIITASEKASIQKMLQIMAKEKEEADQKHDDLFDNEYVPSKKLNAMHKEWLNAFGKVDTSKYDVLVSAINKVINSTTKATVETNMSAYKTAYSEYSSAVSTYQTAVDAAIEAAANAYAEEKARTASDDAAKYTDETVKTAKETIETNINNLDNRISLSVNSVKEIVSKRNYVTNGEQENLSASGFARSGTSATVTKVEFLNIKVFKVDFSSTGTVSLSQSVGTMEAGNYTVSVKAAWESSSTRPSYVKYGFSGNLDTTYLSGYSEKEYQTFSKTVKITQAEKTVRIEVYGKAGDVIYLTDIRCLRETQELLDDLDAKIGVEVGKVSASVSDLYENSLHNYCTNGDFSNSADEFAGWARGSTTLVTKETHSSKSCVAIKNENSSTYVRWYQKPFSKAGKITVRFKAACASGGESTARIRVTIDSKSYYTTAGELSTSWKTFEIEGSATPDYFYTYFYNYVSGTTVYITDVEILGYASSYSESQLTILKDSIEAEVKRATKGEEDLKASIKVNAENITSKVSKGDMGSYITQYYNNVIIAFNKNSKYVQINPGEIAIYDYGVENSKKRAVFDERGNHFYRDNYYIGKIGTNEWKDNSAHKGLVFDLEPEGKYMAFAQKASASATSYTTMLCFSRANSIYDEYGVNLGCNLIGNWYTLKNFKIGSISAGGYTAFSGAIPIVCEITNNGNSWTYSHLRVYNGIIVGYWN